MAAAADLASTPVHWERVREQLSARRYDDLSGDELDLLADAAFWGCEHDRSVDVRRDAYRAHVANHDRARAAMAAWRLFYDHFLVGELAPATGWLERCRRHAESVDDDVVRGWLAIADSDRAAAEGDHARALDLARAARGSGERIGDADLTAMALQAEGRALIVSGDRVTGVSRLDEAMVAVVNDELSPLFTGWVYCNVVATCHAIADLRRASEWSAAAMRWCATLRDGAMYPGLCRVYAVELAYLRGEWDRALADAERACAELAAFEPRYAGAAFGVLGDLRRLRGELDGAADAYRRAHELGATPQPGMALLTDARGDHAAALQALRSATLAGPDEPLPRAFLLVALADVASRAGDDEVADEALGSLAEIGDDGGGLLDAIALTAQAELAARADRLESAVATLRRAVELLAELGFPYEAARRRILLASLLRAAGDDASAGLELDCAAATFAALGAALDLATVDRFRGAGQDSQNPLSEREVEVLALVARGRTNNDIAADLVVSPHTVARHMTNIRTKLGVHSRAAAVAEATRRGWLTGH